MSHIDKYRAAIADLDCLNLTMTHVGMEFDRSATQFMYYGGAMHPCHGKLSVQGNKDAYEVGLEKNASGTYDLLFDSYQGGKGLIDKIGQEGKTLMNEYAGALFTKHIARQGMQVRRQVKADGSLLMVAE